MQEIEAKKLRAALPGEVKLQQELLNLLREGKREEHRNLLKLKQGAAPQPTYIQE